MANTTSANLTGRLDLIRKVSAGRAITPLQIAVLRRIVLDADFRKAFAVDPSSAVSQSGVAISASELGNLVKLSPEHLEQFAFGVGEVIKADDGCTHTLLYAIIVALVLAETERTIEEVSEF